MKAPRERFWEKVDKTGPCWLWTASVDRHGYGRFMFEGRTHKAHRLSLEWATGRRPLGLDACHAPKEICGHTNCVNPAHLRWDTQTGNFADKVKDGTDPSGERNPNAKLTAAKVLAIRADVAAGEPQRSVARRYGVGKSTVNYIVTRRIWAHVGERSHPVTRDWTEL